MVDRMSGLTSRNKGRRGEREACDLLTEKGFEIIELGPGRKTEDVVCAMGGTTYSVEVKNHLVWHLTAWRKQAKEQATKRKSNWLLLCRIPNMPATFYVEGTHHGPCVWRGNRARRAER